MNSRLGKQIDRWEGMWAPHDMPTYRLILEKISANDIVLEIGAGDLRLSRLLARHAKRVYALEINRALLHRSSNNLPSNVQVIAADARTISFPRNITVAVLLMRHCTHFALYYNKLQTAGCQKLLTNARWGMNVETVDLNASRHKFQSFEIGWYACRCGNCGFKTGSPESLSAPIAGFVWELGSCPACKKGQ